MLVGRGMLLSSPAEVFGFSTGRGTRKTHDDTSRVARSRCQNDRRKQGLEIEV